MPEQLSLFDNTLAQREADRAWIEERERAFREEMKRIQREADERRCERYNLIFCPECHGEYTVDDPGDGRHKCARCEGRRFLHKDGRRLTNQQSVAVFFGDDMPTF